MIVKTIELDCPPGHPRPGDLIGGVVSGTPAERLLCDPVSQVFGNWTWRFDTLSDDEWQATQNVVQPRIEALYRSGTIRYGSW